MKKLVLLLAVAFSVSMFSCGGGENANGCDSDSCKAAEEATEAAAPVAEEAVAEATEVTEEAAPATEEEAAPATEEAPAEAAK